MKFACGKSRRPDVTLQMGQFLLYVISYRATHERLVWTRIHDTYGHESDVEIPLETYTFVIYQAQG